MKIKQIVEAKPFYQNQTLLERMQELHTPGISMALVQNFELKETFTYGEKDREFHTKVTPGTMFQAASISKPVFAAAVMRLVQEGKLDLDADIQTYLGDFTYPTYDGQPHPVTLRQLLSHTAGFNVQGFSGYRPRQALPNIEQILRGAPPANSPRLKLVNPPGSRFAYSGGGVTLAQKIVQDVCQEALPSLMEKWILSDFYMLSSIFVQPLPSELRERVARGYDFYDLPLAWGYNAMPEQAAAGLWTTPADLARFGLEIMRALRGESPWLNQASAQAMTTPVGKDLPYGVGLRVWSMQRGCVFGHSGGNIGFHSIMRFCPAEGNGLVAMLNADIGEEIIDEVMAAFQHLAGWQ